MAFLKYRFCNAYHHTYLLRQKQISLLVANVII